MRFDTLKLILSSCNELIEFIGGNPRIDFANYGQHPPESRLSLNTKHERFKGFESPDPFPGLVPLKFKSTGFLRQPADSFDKVKVSLTDFLDHLVKSILVLFY